MSDIVAAYADGGVIGRNPSSEGGTWAFCLVDARGETVRCGAGIIFPHEIGLPAVSNNVAEFCALWRALEALPAGWSGRVYSDSQVTLGRFFWGWNDRGLPSGWLVDGLTTRQELGRLEPILLDGHPTQAQLKAGVGKRGNPVSRFNAWCDLECQRMAARFREAPERAVEWRRCRA